MKKVKKIAPIVIFFGIIVFVLIKDAVKAKKLQQNHRFTIGTVKKILNASDGGPLAEYNFVVYGKVFSSSLVIPTKKDLTIGESYIVKFNPRDPNNSKMLKDKHLKKLKNAPDSGWADISDLIQLDK